MKTKTTSILLAAFFGALTAHAQLTIPSDGSDGAFAPATNVEIDLGLATTALWTAPGSGNGVYDAEKWAVVFKYSSVNIPAGVTVTFKNHPTYAPVVWLVQGNVTIGGTLSLRGKDGTNDAVGRLVPSEPGPGGFRGGATGPSGSGAGYGPAGGTSVGEGRYAGFYGNPQILPLIGGSGGGGRNDGYGQASGAGAGGAVLIATPGTINVGGMIDVRDGNPLNNARMPGSPGAIRLIANAVSGSGILNAVNSTYSISGRVRIESNSLATTLQTFPETIGVPPSSTPVIWPAANAPVARVISVDSINAPLDPNAPVVAAADVAIQNSNQVAILIETQNFPIEGVVQLRIMPKFGNRTTLNATRLSGDITSATWRVQTTLPQGFVTLQARATQP
jgi:hypothetical protein